MARSKKIARSLAVVAAVILVAAGALVRSFAAAPLPVGATPAFAEPVAHPPQGMKLLAIQSGRMFSNAAFAYRGGSFDDARSFVMGGVLVRHPMGDLLFDTGFGRNVDAHVTAAPALMRKTTKYAKGTPIVDQLAAAGIDARMLKGIVLTHAHWDHVSGIDDMRETPLWVTQAERDFIESGGLPTELIRSFGKLPYRIYDFSGGPYLGFERSYDVFGDGSVVLVPAGGHTPGSVIAFITLPEGKRYALVGDIVWQKEGVEIPAERPWVTRTLADVDQERVRTVIVRLHQLAQRFPDLVIVPAHDEHAWAKLPKLQ